MTSETPVGLEGQPEDQNWISASTRQLLKRAQEFAEDGVEGNVCTRVPISKEKCVVITVTMNSGTIGEPTTSVEKRERQ